MSRLRSGAARRVARQALRIGFPSKVSQASLLRSRTLRTLQACRPSLGSSFWGGCMESIDHLPFLLWVLPLVAAGACGLLQRLLHPWDVSRSATYCMVPGPHDGNLSCGTRTSAGQHCAASLAGCGEPFGLESPPDTDTHHDPIFWFADSRNHFLRILWFMWSF